MQALTHLNLAFNNVTPAAVMVIANSLRRNETVDFLSMDGNKLGRRGAAALMGALRSGSRSKHVSISVAKCDSTSVDPSLFNPLEPQGMYVPPSSSSVRVTAVPPGTTLTSASRTSGWYVRSCTTSPTAETAARLAHSRTR